MAVKRNEKTGKAVARIASSILGNLKRDHRKSGRIYAENINGDLFLIGVPQDYLQVRDLLALAASALTQAPDKNKK